MPSLTSLMNFLPLRTAKYLGVDSFSAGDNSKQDSKNREQENLHISKNHVSRGQIQTRIKENETLKSYAGSCLLLFAICYVFQTFDCLQKKHWIRNVQVWITGRHELTAKYSQSFQFPQFNKLKSYNSIVSS